MTQLSFASKRRTEPEIWDKIDLSVIWGEQGITGSYLPHINCVNGHIIAVAAFNNANASTAVFEKGGDWKQKFILGTGAATNGSSPGGAYAHQCAIHSDIMLMSNGGTNHYGMNLRETGAARTINNAAALAGIPVSPSTDASAGGGWVAMPALSPGCSKGFYQFEDSRYLVQPSGSDTTSPTVTTPAAPTVAGAITGGYLAAGDFDVKIAWVTKRNIYQTGQGITQPSALATANVASGTTGRIDVTIPTQPSADAVGYVVYVGATGGTLYACGGGSAPLSGTKTHVIKATMAQLDMGNRFLYYGTTMRMGRVVNLENSSPITWGTARAYTSSFDGGLWSPFFKDSTIWYGLPVAPSIDGIYKADKFDLGPTDGTMSLNQTLTNDGEPALVIDRGAYSATYSQILTVKSIPEIMAYAVGTPGATNAGILGKPGFIQIRSCLNNAVLTNITFPDINPYATSEVAASGMSFFDFEFIDGVLWCYVASIKHRAILRMPVRF